MKRTGWTTFTKVCRTVLLAASLVLTSLPVSHSPVQAHGPTGNDVADLVDQLIDAVVNISTAQTVGGTTGIPMPDVPEGSPFKDFFEDFFNRPDGPGRQPQKVQSLGSGFVIDPSGIIITNNHVIAEADEIFAIFNDGRKLQAELIGRDPKSDLAVLRVKSDKPLAHVSLGDSDSVRVGHWVIAIGNPFSLGGSVTAGIVSARNRDINAGPYDDFIQTDAAINRGNSGGPLFNMNGEVIGVNTAIISPTGGSIGIGFSIPSNNAKPIIAQLQNFGETRRGWLGVRIQPVTEPRAKELGLASAYGAYISGTSENGPAADAGLKEGDVILSFAGKRVDKMRDLPRIVAQTRVGATVDVIIQRDKKQETVSVTIGRLQNKGAEKAKAKEPALDLKALFGLTLGEISDDFRKTHSIASDVTGVAVIDVLENSIAAEQKLKAGDVIVEVAQVPITSVEQLAGEIKKLLDAKRTRASLLVFTGDGEVRYVSLPLDS